MAISERACVAVEAMEGADAMLRRAASLVNGRPLRLVKASRKHLLFDVPVAGLQPIDVMQGNRYDVAGSGRATTTRESA